MTSDELTAALQAALPDVTTPQRLAGLDGEATIYRDPWGIPHIRARSESDLYFAQGFATAQDRLWQMDADRHQALGRWSEWVGARGLARDRLLRAAGMGRTAKLDLEVCSAAARGMVASYTAGVNAFMETTASLPVEYVLLGEEPEPWHPWHCVAVYKVRNSLLGTFEPKLWRSRWLLQAGVEEVAALVGEGSSPGQLLTVPPGAQYSGPPLDGAVFLQAARQALLESGVDAGLLTPGALPAEIDTGSNGWSIAASRSATGQPLMGGDSHRGLDTPNVYYQVHLACDDFDVIGHSVPGVPGALHFCHNEHVAWGMTHGAADTQDLYLERFREGPGEAGAGTGRREVETATGWRAAQVWRETLRVRGGEEVQMEVTVTDHGPVIAGDPGSGWGVTIRDPGLIEGTPWLDAARDAMHADSIDALHHAFRHWTDRINNYAVADTGGHFGYLHEGRIPVRGEANGWAAVPGWDGTHEWQGMIPPDELPRAIDPPEGWAVTCNQRVADADYPCYVGLLFAPDFRARRVRDRLLALPAGTATVEAMQAVHADCESIPARVFVERLLAAMSARGRAGRGGSPAVGPARGSIGRGGSPAVGPARGRAGRGDAPAVGPAQGSIGRGGSPAVGPPGLPGGGDAPGGEQGQAAAGGDTAPRQREEALAALRSWDCRMDRDQVAPAIYAVARRALTQRLLVHVAGAAAEGILSGEAGGETHARLMMLRLHRALAGEIEGGELLPPGRGWDEMLQAAFDTALAELAPQLGDDVSQWTWGRLHHCRHRHPLSEVFPAAQDWLDPVPRALHGDGDTPLAGSFGLSSFTVTGASVNRYLMDPADWRRSRWIVPLGASGHPASPHYADQAARWAQVDYIPMLWDWGQIEAEAETTQALSG